MVKHTRQSFKRDLVDALEDKDLYVSNEDIEEFLNLNFDEDSSLANWGYREFSDFAFAVGGAESFWDAVREADLNIREEDEDDWDDLDWDDPEDEE